MTNPLDIEHTTSCGHTWTMRHTACPDCFAEMRQRAVAAEVALAEWRKHDRAPDCVACAVLDAALAGGGE